MLPDCIYEGIPFEVKEPCQCTLECHLICCAHLSLIFATLRLLQNLLAAKLCIISCWQGCT